jgi:hypothetical protein
MFHPDQIDRIDHSAPPPVDGGPSDHALRRSHEGPAHQITPSEAAASGADPYTYGAAAAAATIPILSAALDGGGGGGIGGGAHPTSPPGARARLGRLSFGFGNSDGGGSGAGAGGSGGGGHLQMAGVSGGSPSAGIVARTRLAFSNHDVIIGSGGGGGGDPRLDPSAAMGAAEEGGAQLLSGHSSGAHGGGRKGGGGRPGGLKAQKKKVVMSGVHLRSWLKIDHHGETSMIQADKYKLTHKLGVQVWALDWDYFDTGVQRGRGLARGCGVLSGAELRQASGLSRCVGRRGAGGNGGVW